MSKAPAAEKLPVVSKEKIKPETLPVDIGGGNIQFLKRADYAKRTAENYGLKHKVDMKKDHVTQMLDALDKGTTELPAETPEDFLNLFNIVSEDYIAGIEEVERLKQLEADKLAKEEADKKEKAEAEEKLFLAVKDKNPNLGDLAGKFDTGNMDRFIAKADVSTEDLLGALGTGLKLGDFNGWMIGDLIVELENRGQLAVVARLAEEKGESYSKIYNDAKTARAIPPDQRRKNVSFTIYREVANAKFTDDQKKKGLPALLADVAEGKHTTQTVREAVRTLQGKTPPADLLPEEDPKFVFLVLDPNTGDLTKAIQTTVGFPKDLFSEGSVVVNPRTKEYFVKNGFAKKAENRWEKLPEYVKPEAAPVTPATQVAPTKKGKKK